MNDFNQKDVSFVNEMIKHHEAAIKMATDIYLNGKNMWVKTLATNIIIDQSKEIETMKNWLKTNQQTEDATDMPGME